MRILITFAVDAEFAPWRKLRDFRKISAALFEMANEDHKVKVILTGIGREQVGGSFVRSGILSSMTPDAVVSSGLAGALKESMKPGDLIAPQKVRTLRNDANADADCYLRARAIERGASPIESLITMDRIVSTAVEKERLSFFGEAVDMESAIIMSHCAASAIPAVTIRAVSDAADEDLPLDFDRFLTPQGAIKPMSLVNAVVRRPGKLPGLVRFGRQSNQAAQKLVAFLDGFVAALPSFRQKVTVV